MATLRVWFSLHWVCLLLLCVFCLVSYTFQCWNWFPICSHRCCCCYCLWVHSIAHSAKWKCGWPHVRAFVSLSVLLWGRGISGGNKRGNTLFEISKIWFGVLFVQLIWLLFRMIWNLLTCSICANYFLSLSLSYCFSFLLFLLLSFVYKQSAKFALAQLIVFHMVSFAGKDISVYHCNIPDDCLLLTLKIIIKQAYDIYTFICRIIETPAIMWVMKGKIPTRFIYMQWYLKWEDWTHNVYMNKRNLCVYTRTIFL